MAESSVWHQEEKTADWTEYYVTIIDGEKVINFILKHNAVQREVRADPYSPPDINYTIHDSCDHENDECVLDDPDSWESQDVFMSGKYHRAEAQLRSLEKQLLQQRVAERLVRTEEDKE